MAKSPRPVAGAGANTIDPDVALRHVKHIESFTDRIEEIRGEMGGKIGAVKKKRDEAYAKAKEDGIPRKALKSIIQKRELERKMAAIKAKLVENDEDGDEVAAYEQLEEALGPLGAAARAANQNKAKAERARKPTSEEAPTQDDIAEKRREQTAKELKEFEDADPSKKAAPPALN